MPMSTQVAAEKCRVVLDPHNCDVWTCMDHCYKMYGTPDGGECDLQPGQKYYYQCVCVYNC